MVEKAAWEGQGSLVRVLYQEREVIPQVHFAPEITSGGKTVDSLALKSITSREFIFVSVSVCASLSVIFVCGNVFLHMSSSHSLVM